MASLAPGNLPQTFPQAAPHLYPHPPKSPRRTAWMRHWNLKGVRWRKVGRVAVACPRACLPVCLSACLPLCLEVFPSPCAQGSRELILSESNNELVFSTSRKYELFFGWLLFVFICSFTFCLLLQTLHIWLTVVRRAHAALTLVGEQSGGAWMAKKQASRCLWLGCDSW